jgi:hypothetical protein
MRLHHSARSCCQSYRQVLHRLVGGRARSQSVSIEFVVFVGEFGYFHRVSFLFSDGGLVKGEEVLFRGEGADAVKAFFRGAERCLRRLVFTGAWSYGLAHLTHFV